MKARRAQIRYEASIVLDAKWHVFCCARRARDRLADLVIAERGKCHG